eukprot:scaffold1557_cov246-Pinguiococcus_pyrenoidosus.AAC.2
MDRPRAHLAMCRRYGRPRRICGRRGSSSLSEARCEAERTRQKDTKEHQKIKNIIIITITIIIILRLFESELAGSVSSQVVEEAIV